MVGYNVTLVSEAALLDLPFQAVPVAVDVAAVAQVGSFGARGKAMGGFWIGEGDCSWLLWSRRYVLTRTYALLERQPCHALGGVLSCLRHCVSAIAC
jgi:hypothetical protein